MIDLSRLNRHVITPHFKMEMLDSVCLSLKKHDWAISLDLTDAYFHIPIRPNPRDVSVSISWENISVSIPCLRFSFSSLCVFPNCEGSNKALSMDGYASSFIPIRLTATVSVSSCVSVSQRTTSECGVVPEICSQSGQVGVSSQSDIFFPGSSFLSRKGADRSIFRQAHEVTIINSENVVSSSCISPTNPFPVGSNGVMARLLPEGRAHKRLLQWQTKDRWSQADKPWDFHISLGPWFSQAVS